jgi:hypothetical protein
MLYAIKVSEIIQGSCKLDGHTLEHVPFNSYVGVQIQEDLKWKEHINNITKKSQFHLGLPKKEFTTLSERM